MTKKMLVQILKQEKLRVIQGEMVRDLLGLDRSNENYFTSSYKKNYLS